MFPPKALSEACLPFMHMSLLVLHTFQIVFLQMFAYVYIFPNVCYVYVFPNVCYVYIPPNVCLCLHFFKCLPMFTFFQMFANVYISPNVCSPIMSPFDPASVPRNRGQHPPFALVFSSFFVQTKLKRLAKETRAVFEPVGKRFNFYIWIHIARCSHHIWELMGSRKAPFKQGGSFYFFFESFTPTFTDFCQGGRGAIFEK